MSRNIDVISNVLDLVSFILVTPELIGMERIEAFNKLLRRLTVAIISSAVELARSLLYDTGTFEPYDPEKWSRLRTLLSLSIACVTVFGMLSVIHSILPETFQVSYSRYWPSGFLYFSEALFGFVFLSWGWEYLLRKYRVTRIMLAIGALLFFSARILAIVHSIEGA
jgi:hypothetical protein